jgi:hypothetical protein
MVASPTPTVPMSSVGLDQRDVEHLAEGARQRRRGHPAGGAAAGDHDAADGLVLLFHDVSCLCFLIG